jgi:hypothetical protein
MRVPDLLAARTMQHPHSARLLLCLHPALPAVCLQHNPHLRCDCVRGLPQDQVI